MPVTGVEDLVMRAIRSYAPEAMVLDSWSIVARCLDTDGRIVAHGLNVEAAAPILRDLRQPQ